MKKLLAILLLVTSSSLLQADELSFDDMSFDDLFYHSSRKGNTDERKKNKADAHAELSKRGAETLRFYVQHTHIENYRYFVRIFPLMPPLTTQSRPIPDEDASTVLRAALSSEHKKVRRTALFFLPRTTAPENTDWILAHLDNEDDAGMAIRLLGLWGITSQAERIAGFLDHEKERRRIISINALGDLGQSASIPHLLPMLRDEFFTVRYAASRALVHLDARKAVLKALTGEIHSNENLQALRHLVQTAGALKDKKAKRVIVGLLSHTDEGVRLDAARALRDIDSDNIPARAKEDSFIQHMLDDPASESIRDVLGVK